MQTTPVWYAAYGSNMNAARFGCYVSGGRAAGALRPQEGCRDPAPPVADRPYWLDGQVYFALESRTWTGGLALYDPDTDGRVAARAYLVTGAQLADIAAQEMHRAPEGDLDVSRVPPNGRGVLGAGRYETLVDCGMLDGHRVFTLAATWSMGAVPWAPPSAAYLRMLASGLAEAHGWDEAQVVEYLLQRPGVRLAWSGETLARALHGQSGTG